MNAFVVSPAADDDLEAIDAHLSNDSSEAAVRVLRALRVAMHQLGEHPWLGHIRPDLTARPVRFWPVYSYLLVYRPDTSPVQIVRVVHGARDVEALLKD